MQLATFASFLMLLNGIFGKVIDKNNDLNAITAYDKKSSMNNVKIFSSNNDCSKGVKSVSVMMFTSDIRLGEFVNINESCSRIDKSKSIFFLAHGFIANATAYNFSDLASRLVEKGYTVFSIDWSYAACEHEFVIKSLIDYGFAANNTREVGKREASMIKSMIDNCGIPLKNISLMGHSLGAHVSGFACKELQNSGYGKCPFLIATDPAAPQFENNKCGDRLCVTDATHVTALHTSGLGIPWSIATCDFWFESGIGQPACGANIKIIDFLNLSCSHNIAIIYLIILLDCEFAGVPVSSKSDCCKTNIANAVSVNNTLLNSNYNGNYCINDVTTKYPYGARNCKYQ